MPVYAAAVFLAAFLLFQVQPVLGKFILPRFGGGAAVWTACLLFFQVMLVCGYAWAHSLRRWFPNADRRLHAVLLAASLASIPILPPADWRGYHDAPIADIVLLLILTVGVPYLALAATGPLLQSWSADRFPERSPYRLYALSNVGSLLGLLTYPVLVEPLLTRDEQVIGWSSLYLLLVGLLLGAAFGSRQPRRSMVAKPSDASPAPGTRQVASWLLLSACAAALLMAVTNHLSQEVAVVPFLWILPLALYLLSFIVAFDSDRWYDRRAALLLLAVLLPAAVWSLGEGLSLDLRWAITIWGGLLLTLCTSLHGELARQRPPSDRLTQFYVTVAAGGALGGFFVAVLAPLMFTGFWELHLAIGVAVATILDEWLRATRAWPSRWRRLIAGTAAAAQLMLALALFQDLRHFEEDVVTASRNFYGVLRVVRDEDPAAGDSLVLYHGQTKHGLQFVRPALRCDRTSYYAPESGIGLAIEHHPRRDTERLDIGVVGLGVGTVAAYGRSQDRVRFWELDPAVETLARSAFTYLQDCRATVDVVLGDARLRMAEEARDTGNRYDVIAVDAFSSDAIPIHLLTTEAAALYWSLLEEDGLLAFHVSNRFVDLEPVVTSLARDLGAAAVRFRTERSRNLRQSQATWLVLARPDHPFLRLPLVLRAGQPLDSSGPLVRWTDDFASLWPVLEFD